MDIKLLNGEIELEYDDFAIVSDDLLQDIKSLLFTDLGALFYDNQYGSSTLRYIQANNISKLKQDIRIALSKDSRIDANSINVKLEKNDYSVIMDIDFNTINGQELHIQEVI